MSLHISPTVLTKLQDKHNVSRKEVQEAFDNLVGPLLIDDREQDRTDPPTMWFIAETNHKRRLKICFVQRDQDLHIRTAYEPNDQEIAIYERRQQAWKGSRRP